MQRGPMSRGPCTVRSHVRGGQSWEAEEGWGFLYSTVTSPAGGKKSSLSSFYFRTFGCSCRPPAKINQEGARILSTPFLDRPMVNRKFGCWCRRPAAGRRIHLPVSVSRGRTQNPARALIWICSTSCAYCSSIWNK